MSGPSPVTVRLQNNLDRAAPSSNLQAQFNAGSENEYQQYAELAQVQDQVKSLAFLNNYLQSETRRKNFEASSPLSTASIHQLQEMQRDATVQGLASYDYGVRPGPLDNSGQSCFAGPFARSRSQKSQAEPEHVPGTYGATPGGSTHRPSNAEEADNEVYRLRNDELQQNAMAAALILNRNNDNMQNPETALQYSSSDVSVGGVPLSVAAPGAIDYFLVPPQLQGIQGLGQNPGSRAIPISLHQIWPVPASSVSEPASTFHTASSSAQLNMVGVGTTVHPVNQYGVVLPVGTAETTILESRAPLTQDAGQWRLTGYEAPYLGSLPTYYSTGNIRGYQQVDSLQPYGPLAAPGQIPCSACSPSQSVSMM